MIHRLEIAKDIVVICGEKFLEEFNNCLSKEIIAKTNKNKYDK